MSKTIDVLYPHSGRYVALNWFTYNARGRLLLARTEAQLRERMPALVASYGAVEVYSVTELEIVAPSKRLCELVEDWHYRKAVYDFHHRACWRMVDLALKKGHELPQPFAVCKTYVKGVSHWVGEDDKKKHSGCAACVDRIRLVGMTPAEFYDKYHDRWPDERDPFRRVPVVKTRPSMAPIAADDEALCFAEFDEQYYGVRLHRVDTQEMDDDGLGHRRPEYTQDSVLFFYRKLAEIEKRPFQKLSDSLGKKDRKKIDEIEKMEKEKRVREEVESDNKILSLFEDNSNE